MAKQFKTTIAPPALSMDPSGTYAGEIYYNTTLGTLKIFNGSTWDLLTGSGTGSVTSNSFEVLANPPASPAQGRAYFNSSENTIKVYNGLVWYDVAGPKSILEHDHEINGLVNSVDYGNYVSEDKIFANAGSTSSTYIDNYIDGGGA